MTTQNFLPTQSQTQLSRMHIFFSVATARTTKRKLMCDAGLGDKRISPEMGVFRDHIRDHKKEMEKKSKLELQYGDCVEGRTCKDRHIYRRLTTEITAPVVQVLIEGEMINKEKPLHGRRWSTEQKLAGLLKWKLGPKRYRIEEQIPTIPNTRTLQRMLTKIPIDVGLNQNVLQAIKIAAASLKPHEKYVGLMFDEMAIKIRLIYRDGAPSVRGFGDYGDHEQVPVVADHALVSMLRGLATSFKQPIAYYYTSAAKNMDPAARLSSLIRKVIEAVNDTGLIVATAVCDQAPTNRAALALLKKQSVYRNQAERDNSTYFMVADKLVYYLYDVPHIIKCLRTQLMGDWQKWLQEQKNKSVTKFDVPGQQMEWGETEEDRRVAKWCHIIWLYNAQLPNFRDGTKLQENVVFPGTYDKMRVCHAVTVFSGTMARN